MKSVKKNSITFLYYTMTLCRYRNVRLDETIDAYLLTMTLKYDAIRPIWNGLGEPCAKDQIGVIGSVIVKKEFVT